MTATLIPEPGPERVRFVDRTLEAARRGQLDGEPDRASETIVEALRAGLWSHSRLWTELLSVTAEPQRYRLIRSLWLASPPRCHGRTSIVSVVARAAALAGEHDDARALLRKAIVREGYRRRRPRAVLGRAGRRAAARVRANTSHRIRALIDVSLVMEEVGARPFLRSHTLRRYAHRCSLAFRDDLLEVGFLGLGVSLGELRLALTESAMFSIEHLDSHPHQARVRHENRVRIDLRPHRREDDGTVWLDAPDVRWRHRELELAPLPIPGELCFVPSPVERYLRESYPDWRAVPEDFDPRLDAPNAQMIDQDLFDTYSYWSFLSALTSDALPLSRRYAGILRERGEADWLDRLRVFAARAGRRSAPA